MTKLFISHSSQDDAFVRDLRAALADHGQDGWIDSRELRGGDPLWPEIQKAIEAASAYAVVISTNALQSKWVGRELRYALDLQKQRGKDKFPVIPLSLNGTKLGVLEEFFGEEPLYLPVSSEAGGVEAAMNAILIAVGKRLPADVAPTPQPKAEPLEELVLELTDLKFHEQDGVRRASALAELVYEPATPGKEKLPSENSWRFIAPMGPIEFEDIRWYLEKYAIWPSEFFKDRARKIEQSLKEWGRSLYDAAFPKEHVANVREAWAKVPAEAGRRFSVFVKSKVEAGASAERQESAREVATALLGLPWELLHDGTSYLFQGAHPTRVRRRLPRTKSFDVPIVATPIRTLLVTARPEDDACGYIDHRASALPLVEAMEDLGGRVRLRVLSPPTLPALREELDRARREGKPYHVVHFDGHGVYDRRIGLGGLCFEDPRDIGLLDKRRHITVTTEDLGPLLRSPHPARLPRSLPDRAGRAGVRVCRLRAAEGRCGLRRGHEPQRARRDRAPLRRSVLRRARRRRPRGRRNARGPAQAEGRHLPRPHLRRGRAAAGGLVRARALPGKGRPAALPHHDRAADAGGPEDRARGACDLPAEPETGFIGRSRELLALERLLRVERYAVVRGQGGEGKTALAAELARWMVRSHQIRRAAFVSVETHCNVKAVLDAIGRQLVPNYSVATFDDLEKAILPVERALTEQSTLLVVDNMESVLLPPFMVEETPEALSAESQRELDAILRLCARLNAKGDTRFVFTSREALPAPFDAERHRRELHQLAHEDAVKLVERVLNREAAGAGAVADAAREGIEQLVDAVHGHARTLALLAPALRSRGVDTTRASLVELMAEMERRFPGSREQSVFASVELSLRRMSPANRDRARVLGVFHGGVDANVLVGMMGWKEADVVSLADELIATGLATPTGYGHLTLNPALCPYLCGQIDAAEREALTARWGEAMRAYAEILNQQQNAEMAATLTGLELPNLFALLEQVQRAGDAETTIALATLLYGLLHNAGKPRLLERVAQVRDRATAALGETWSRAHVDAQRTRIAQQLAGGRLREAFDGAQALVQRARAAGEKAYPGANYDLAAACFTLARVLHTAGGSEQTLPLLDEAQQRFEAVARERASKAAEKMASVCFTERGVCLSGLGRLDEAAAAYEEGIRRDE